MKKKKLYQILPLFLSGVCVLGMCAVGTRIAAKKILIGKLGIENYVTCALADYNWGDRLERVLGGKRRKPGKAGAPRRVGKRFKWGTAGREHADRRSAGWHFTVF